MSDESSKGRPRRWLIAWMLVTLVVALLGVINGLSSEHRSWLGDIALWLGLGALVLLALGLTQEIRRSGR